MIQFNNNYLSATSELPSGVAGSVGGAASDAVLGGLGSAFVSAANGVSAAALAVLSVDSSVKSRVSYGGTAPKNVRAQAKKWLKRLQKASL